MRRIRASLLAPIFSTMAVLSFKKKGKEETIGTGTSSLSGLELSGDTVSLGSLGGGLGTLSKLSEIGQSSGELSDGLLADAAPRSDKKLQEVEANVNDLKSHVESTDLTTRAMKGEMESIKSDLSQINDSIRTLLNVYEAVSRQYNPFVDGEPEQAVPARPQAKAEVTMCLKDLAPEQPAIKTEVPTIKVESAAKEHKVVTPFDDDGPLDRIVRPEEDEVLAINKEASAMSALEPATESHMFNDMKPKMVRAVPAARTSPLVDVYELDHIRRLVDHLMGKICMERSNGNEIMESDIRALDLWMSEFMRLGGL